MNFILRRCPIVATNEQKMSLKTKVSKIKRNVLQCMLNNTWTYLYLPVWHRAQDEMTKRIDFPSSSRTRSGRSSRWTFANRFEREKRWVKWNELTCSNKPIELTWCGRVLTCRPFTSNSDRLFVIVDGKREVISSRFRLTAAWFLSNVGIIIKNS